VVLLSEATTEEGNGDVLKKAGVVAFSDGVSGGVETRKARSCC